MLNHGSMGKMSLLRIGMHDYFGKQIEVLPVRTLANGLCYKLEFANYSLPYETMKYLVLLVTRSNQLQDMDEIKRINLLIASKS